MRNKYLLQVLQKAKDQLINLPERKAKVRKTISLVKDRKTIFRFWKDRKSICSWNTGKLSIFGNTGNLSGTPNTGNLSQPPNTGILSSQKYGGPFYFSAPPKLSLDLKFRNSISCFSSSLFYLNIQNFNNKMNFKINLKLENSGWKEIEFHILIFKTKLPIIIIRVT